MREVSEQLAMSVEAKISSVCRRRRSDQAMTLSAHSLSIMNVIRIGANMNK